MWEEASFGCRPVMDSWVIAGKICTVSGYTGHCLFLKEDVSVCNKKGKNLEPVWLDQKKRPAYNTNLHLTMDRAVAYVEQGLTSGFPVAMLNGPNPCPDDRQLSASLGGHYRHMPRPGNGRH